MALTDSRIGMIGCLLTQDLLPGMIVSLTKVSASVNNL